MNLRIPLYQLTRSGASLYRTRLESVDIAPDQPGQQLVQLALRVEETLLGEPGEPLRRAEFTQPESQLAQLKYPDPTWGRVTLETGKLIFLATHALDETPADPLYADEISQPEDPVFSAVSAVLSHERQVAESLERRDRYFSWLTGDEPVAKLFAAEALAREPGLSGGDPQGHFSHAYIQALEGPENPYVLMSVAAAAFDSFYNHAGPESRVVLLNGLIGMAGEEASPLQDFALDRLSTLDPVELMQKGVVNSTEAAGKLQARLVEESDAESRDRLLKIIKILRGGS